MKIRIFFAVVTIFVGIGLAIFHALQSHWMSSIAFLMLGGLVSFCCFVGFLQSFAMPEWKGIAALVGVLGIYAVLSEHRAFDMERAKAHTEVLVAFMRIDINCRDKSNELEALKLEGIRACALQDNFEMMNAIGELQKANTLGPTLSIVDGVRSAAIKPDSDWCAEAYLATRSLCPLAFSALSKVAASSLESSK